MPKKLPTLVAYMLRDNFNQNKTCVVLDVISVFTLASYW